jgi:hypothetical protein
MTLYLSLWKNYRPGDFVYLAIGRSKYNSAKEKRPEINARNRTKCILTGQGLGLMNFWKKEITRLVLRDPNEYVTGSRPAEYEVRRQKYMKW